MTNTSSQSRSRSAKIFHISLWVLQVLISGIFLLAGSMKMLTPIPTLSQQLPWTGEVSPAFVYFTAIMDLLVPVGLLLPAITRTKPQLVPLAALGAGLIMIWAIVFHVLRGESAVIGFNFLMLALTLLVAWGRYKKAPVPTN